MSKKSLELLVEEEDVDDNVGDKFSQSQKSNFCEITCRAVTSSSVIVQWIYLNQNLDLKQDVVFKVLKLETRGEWRKVAWTRKTTCQIDNLEQNVCYSLKIHVLVEDETEFRVVDESQVFKVCFCFQDNLNHFHA